MRFSPMSFLLGLGAACVLPIVSRAFRPFAVEATALGMGAFEELRRLAAEQMENLEDIVAEARARREELVVEAEHGDEGEPENSEEATEEPGEEPPVAGSASQRGPFRG